MEGWSLENHLKSALINPKPQAVRGLEGWSLENHLKSAREIDLDLPICPPPDLSHSPPLRVVASSVAEAKVRNHRVPFLKGETASACRPSENPDEDAQKSDSVKGGNKHQRT